MTKRDTSTAFIFLLLFFILSSSPLSGKKITPSQALNQAEKYLRQIDQKAILKGKKTTFGHKNTLQLTQETDQYYVFNQYGGNGYIVLSADDQTIPVLGYSDENRFDPTNIPPALCQWLEIYQNEIQYISQQNGDPYQETTPDFETYATAESVSPLIKSLWDQGTPFNNLCPIAPDNGEQTVSGCVATAMAMVMHYHQWPDIGVGSHEYITNTLNIRIPPTYFSSTTYDWVNMRNIYDGTSSSLENDAVATLLYHCGVSIDMDYNISVKGGSGARTKDVAEALKQYFKYDTGTHYITRPYYTCQEWKSIIKSELKAGRPVIHNGNTGAGGHAFVCDGFDENDYFHFNWGWSGASNGYFVLSSLNPDFVGIGGFPGGYDQYQGMVIGIQKPNPSTLSVSEWYTSKDMTTSTPLINRTSYISLNSGCYNNGDLFNGTIGIALYQNGELRKVLQAIPAKDVKPGYGFSDKSFSFQIPSSYSEGEYELKMVYKEETSDTYQPMRSSYGVSGILKAIVSTSTIALTPINSDVVLQSAGDLIFEDPIYANSTVSLKIPLQNPTDIDFCSFVALRLSRVGNHSIAQTTAPVFITIPAQTTIEQSISMTSNLPAGTYEVTLAYDPTNLSSQIVENFTSIPLSNAEITLSEKPSGTPLLKADNIVFPSCVEQGEELLASALISNNGPNSVYDNRVFMMIFNQDGEAVKQLKGPSLQLTYPQEQTVTFSDIISLAPGNYYGRILHNKANTWSFLTEELNFSLTSSTSVENIRSSDQSFRLYYGDGSLILIENNSGITSYSIYSLEGKQIINQTADGSNQLSFSTNHLPKGIYLIRITDKEIIHHSAKLIVK